MGEYFRPKKKNGRILKNHNYLIYVGPIQMKLTLLPHAHIAPNNSQNLPLFATIFPSMDHHPPPPKAINCFTNFFLTKYCRGTCSSYQQQHIRQHIHFFYRLGHTIIDSHLVSLKITHNYKNKERSRCIWDLIPCSKFITWWKG